MNEVVNKIKSKINELNYRMNQLHYSKKNIKFNCFDTFVSFFYYKRFDIINFELPGTDRVPNSQALHPPLCGWWVVGVGGRWWVVRGAWRVVGGGWCVVGGRW